MHPISKSFFGEANIRIRLYDGSDIIAAWIISQVGTKSYLVTDGDTEYRVTLAGTTELASYCAGDATPPGDDYSIIEGLGTMVTLFGEEQHYLTKLTHCQAITTDGLNGKWIIDNVQEGLYSIVVDIDGDGDEETLPFAFADLVEEVYEVGGAPATINDIFDENSTWGSSAGPFDPDADVVEGVGLGASSPVLTVPLLSTLQPYGAVFTLVADYRVTQDDAANIDITGFNLYHAKTGDPAPDNEWTFLFAVPSSFADGFVDTLMTMQDYDDVEYVMYSDIGGVGLYRIAVSYSSAGVSASVNGKPVLTRTALEFTATPHPDATWDIFAVQAMAGDYDMAGYIENLTWMPKQPDEDLPTLSTIAP